MKKESIFSTTILLFIFSFYLLSCSTDDNEEKFAPFSAAPCELFTPTPDSLRFKAIYDPPSIKLEQNHIFYSNERIEIEWNLPGDLWNTELQFIETSEPFTCDDYYKFHQLHHFLNQGNFRCRIHKNEYVQFLENSCDNHLETFL